MKKPTPTFTELKLWQHDEDLLQKEIQERLRMANRLENDPQLPTEDWFEAWHDKVMKKIQALTQQESSTARSHSTQSPD
ncbi:MAG: hypothetical protein NZ480_03490 [Bdellovibrionaceae bacterium]|nr:hypothetical protein [Pseudobdellovibrionaceae bacterium]MDW8190634.1 hypothetical protein [Pseudobdellovibrionaceae bacterium]